MTREEAIKIVRNIYQTDKEKEALGVLIPELAESDDERTREFLINFIKLENGTNLSPDDAERCIAYLEKQNEKLNYPTTSRVTILPDGGTVRHTIGYLEKGKKQKPVLAYDENGDVILSDFEAALFSAFSDAWQTYLHGEDVNVVEWAKEHAPELLRVAGKPAEIKIDIPNDQDIIKSFVDSMSPDESLTGIEHDLALYAQVLAHYKAIKSDAQYNNALKGFAIAVKESLNEQKEQKPVLTAKEAWKEMRLEVYAQASGNRHEPNCSDDSTKMFSLCDIDEIFEKIGDSTVGSQPAEWSEEDEKIAKEIEEELWYPGDFPDYPSKEESELYDDCQRRLDWFKNKLKSLRLQPKQEWSNEEKGILMECISVLQNSSHWVLADKLKSLRPRLSWKPSEEQMKWLKDVIETVPLTCRQQLPLESLYADLQKLLLFKDILPQPKPEWSENERQRLKTIAGYLRYKGYEEDACFLESIPPQQKEEGIKGIKGHPDPAGVWKPSNGQLKALKYFLAHHRLQRDTSTAKWEEYDELQSLYDILCTIAKS